MTRSVSLPVDPHIEARQQMVRAQLVPRGIVHPGVLRAMEAVPRHLFLPREAAHEAHGDHPVPIGAGQTISQPYIVALMTQLAEPHPSDQVLDVGTGSGYQTAILAEMLIHVHTMEILPERGAPARRLLESLGYHNITYRIGDGYGGWPEAAPFDVILVAAAADHVPQPLLDQLAPGGRLVMPLGPPDHQELVCIRRRDDGSLFSIHAGAVRFVPMIRSRPEGRIPL